MRLLHFAFAGRRPPAAVAPTTVAPTTAAPTTAAPTTAAVTAEPTTAALSGCFNPVDGGVAVIRQTIGKTAAIVAQTGSVPSTQHMESCGWGFAPGTQLYQYCPGDPYGGALNHPGLRPMGDYSRECVIASPETNGATPPDPMVMVYESEGPRGGVNYTLPSSTGYCRFRIKFYEHSTCANATCASNPATLTLAGQTVWASNADPTTSCATVVSGAFEPGDVITFTERSILALFWLDLVLDGSPGCETVPAEVMASECCGDCSITRAPTTVEANTTTMTTEDPGLLDDHARSSGSDGDWNDGWIVALIVVLVLGCGAVTGVALRRKLTTHVPLPGSDDHVASQGGKEKRGGKGVSSAAALPELPPDQDPASFGLVNLAYDLQAAPTPDTASGDYDQVKMVTDAEGYEVPDDDVSAAGEAGRGADGPAVASAATYDVPGADAVLYSRAVVVTSTASYEVPYEVPGADAVLYATPTPTATTAPLLQAKSGRLESGGQYGERRSARPATAHGGVPATLHLYEQPASSYEVMDYSQMGAYRPPQNQYARAAPAAVVCAYIARDGRKCVGPQVPGGRHCANHACPVPGCPAPKSSRVAACPVHQETEA